MHRWRYIRPQTAPLPLRMSAEDVTQRRVSQIGIPKDPSHYDRLLQDSHGSTGPVCEDDGMRLAERRSIALALQWYSPKTALQRATPPLGHRLRSASHQRHDAGYRNTFGYTNTRNALMCLQWVSAAEEVPQGEGGR